MTSSGLKTIDPVATFSPLGGSHYHSAPDAASFRITCTVAAQWSVTGYTGQYAGYAISSDGKTLDLWCNSEPDYDGRGELVWLTTYAEFNVTATAAGITQHYTIQLTAEGSYL